MQLATVWSAQIPPSPLPHTRDAPRVLSLLGLANSGNGDGCHREPASGKLTLHLAYSDVYAATNICYDNGATATQPGTASFNASGGPNVCPGVFTPGSTTQLADWFARDFMDAPTQFGSVSITYAPVNQVHASVGYTISSVNGTQFFNDARAVNGSLDSTYQSCAACHNLISVDEPNPKLLTELGMTQ